MANTNPRTRIARLAYSEHSDDEVSILAAFDADGDLDVTATLASHMFLIQREWPNLTAASLTAERGEDDDNPDAEVWNLIEPSENVVATIILDPA